MEVYPPLTIHHVETQVCFKVIFYSDVCKIIIQIEL